MIFITEPKQFIKVDNTTYIINGISAKINNAKEVIVGQKEKISFELTFYTEAEEGYKEYEKIIGNFNRSYNIPNIGVVNPISGLFSTNIGDLYNSAGLVAQMYGHTLKPLEDQTFLNS